MLALSRRSVAVGSSVVAGAVVDSGVVVVAVGRSLQLLLVVVVGLESS